MLISFIGGLGGRDISPEEFYEIATITKKAIQDAKPLPPKLLYTQDELSEIRKLQAIAHNELKALKKNE